jgi:hypothetical protein
MELPSPSAMEVQTKRREFNREERGKAATKKIERSPSYISPVAGERREGALRYRKR